MMRVPTGTRHGREDHQPKGATFGLIAGLLAIIAVVATLTLPAASAQSAEPDERETVRGATLGRELGEPGPAAPDRPDTPPQLPTLPAPATDTREEQAERQVINGRPAAIADFPWQVSVASTFDGFFCGGSLIEAHIVLTAAHCVDDIAPTQLVITAGSNIAAEPAAPGTQWRRAGEITLHPDWVPGAPYDQFQGPDLAVIVLDEPFLLGPTVQTIELVTPAETAASLDEIATITGWGVNTLPAADDDTPTALLQGDGIVISDAACQGLIGAQINASATICVDGLETGETSCFGDSGSPVIVSIGGQLKQLAVHSWGIDNCSFLLMGNVEVSSHLSWIATNSPAHVPGTKIVSGRVFQDLDADGLEDPGEPGIGSIPIDLYMPGSLGAPDPVRLSDVSAADGTYSFSTTLGGWYLVEFTLPEGFAFSPLNVGDDDTIDSDVRGSVDGRGPTEPLRIRSMNVIGDVDAGMTPSIPVTGVVFEDTNLDGIRQPGEPLLGGPGFDAIYIDARTDDDDRTLRSFHELIDGPAFAFSLPPGAYDVSLFQPPPGRTITVQNRGDDDLDNDFSPFTGRADAFVATAGATFSFDLGLTPSGVEIFADIANTNCDDTISIVDALVIAQYAALIRTDTPLCPLPDPVSQIRAENGDLNLDGDTNIVDALLVAQCAAGIERPVCP